MGPCYFGSCQNNRVSNLTNILFYGTETRGTIFPDLSSLHPALVTGQYHSALVTNAHAAVALASSSSLPPSPPLHPPFTLPPNTDLLTPTCTHTHRYTHVHTEKHTQTLSTHTCQSQNNSLPTGLRCQRKTFHFRMCTKGRGVHLPPQNPGEGMGLGKWQCMGSRGQGMLRRCTHRG